MTPLEQTQLDCEERARRIEKQWKELPASFAEFTARLASVMRWSDDRNCPPTESCRYYDLVRPDVMYGTGKRDHDQV